MICYRIHFEAVGAHWVIQLQSYRFWGLYPQGWKTVTTQDTESAHILTFQDYEAAYLHALEIGLDRMYRQVGNRPWDRVIAGEQAFETAEGAHHEA